MTLDDAIALLERIAVYSPGMTMSDRTHELWHELLFDIPVEHAVAAVRAHYATTHTWITPADIRRHVARHAGVLPPDPDAALTQARRWSAWRGPAGQPWPTTDEPPVHPAARVAARTLGWTWLDQTPDGVARARWRETYAEASETATRRALAPGGIEAIRRELAAGARPALPPAPVEAPVAEINHERVAQLRASLARMSIKAAPPAPRPDYDPPTDAEKARALDALREWIGNAAGRSA
jgi:hypothetical protein